MKSKVMQEKPYAGSPYVRFDEGAGAPRHSGRFALLYKVNCISALFTVMAAVESSAAEIVNPVYPRSFPDPTTWRAPDGTWRASSTALTILASDDFIHWRPTGKRLFTAEEERRIRAKWKHIWAPDAFKMGDDYLMYVALVDGGYDKAIAVYSSKGPEGPFSDGRIVIDGRKAKLDVIDPEVVRDDRDGTLWLFFGSTSGIHRLRLAKDGKSPAPGAKPKHVAGLDVKKDPSRQKVFEGAYLHRRGGWWYLFASKAWYANHTYATVVGRSRTLTGEFRDREKRRMKDGFATVVISSNKGDKFFGPGHNGEITAIDGRDYIPYHCHVDGENPKARPLFISELFWDKDGWPCVKAIGANRHNPSGEQVGMKSHFPPGATDWIVDLVDPAGVGDAVYPLPVGKVGRYRILWRIPYVHSAKMESATALEISSAGEVRHMTVNQSIGTGTWQEVGVFDLAPGLRSKLLPQNRMAWSLPTVLR